MKKTKDTVPIEILIARPLKLPSKAKQAKKEIFDGITEDIKKGLEYAITRWELLRRNNEFRKEFKICKSTSQKTWEKILPVDLFLPGARSEDNSLMNFILKWSFQPYIRGGDSIYLFNINMTLEDQIDWLCLLQKKRTDWEWGDCYWDALHAFLESTLKMKDVKDSSVQVIDLSKSMYGFIPFHAYRPSSRFANITPQSLQDGFISININLTYSKSELLKTLKELIEEYKPFIGHVKKKKKARTKHRYDLYPRYLKVYDMREKEKMTYKAIAQEFISEGIFEDDLDKDPRGPEIKVIQYYKEAKRIIDNIVDF